MNFDEKLSKNPPMYLESVTYLPEEKQVVLEFTSDLEHTVKYAKTVFSNVEGYQEVPLNEQPEEEFFDSLTLIKGGDSQSDHKEFCIYIDDRQISFFYRDNAKMLRY